MHGLAIMDYLLLLMAPSWGCFCGCTNPPFFRNCTCSFGFLLDPGTGRGGLASVVVREKGGGLDLGREEGRGVLSEEADSIGSLATGRVALGSGGGDLESWKTVPLAVSG